MTSELKERVEKIIERVASHKASTNRLLDHYLASLEDMARELDEAYARTPLGCHPARLHMHAVQRGLKDLTRVTRLWRGES